MTLQQIYVEISKRIGQIDFESIWHGFAPCDFFLYLDKYAYGKEGGMDRPEGFFANTSMEYMGQIVAIWDVTDFDGDLDTLSANLVHEMFHAFQNNAKEDRYPSDLELLSYPCDARVFQIKHQENRLLARMVKSGDYADLSYFAYMRDTREERTGDIIKQEYCAETIEGSAEYAGTMALGQINEEKYAYRIKEYCDLISSVTSLLFDVRRISYYVGTLLLIASKGANKDFCTSRDLPIYEIIARQIDRRQCDIEGDDGIEPLLTKAVQGKKESIEQFLNTSKGYVDFEANIVGYDPMNMIRYQDYILCSHFIFLKRAEETVRIMQPILLCMFPHEHWRIRGYYLK